MQYLGGLPCGLLTRPCEVLQRLSLHSIQRPLSDAFTELAADCGIRLNRSKRSAALSIAACGRDVGEPADSVGLERTTI